ncbi:MAG TPA: haloacid dehalogenase type II [Thermoleophilaceae bacterium]|jgi:2-haloalkanoic acid dehalogenase type II
MPRARLVTFDCYGTLIDWDGGAAAFLYGIALREGDTGAENGRVLGQRWEEIQYELVSGPYKPYKQILAESLAAWAGERGYTLRDSDADDLVRSMRSWQAFPDTFPALTRVREAGMKLAIISNTDRDIIEHSLKHLRVPFDDVFVAEDAGAYKPSDDVFRQAFERFGEDPADIIHVAFGFKYDIPPAQRFGCRTAWVNRYAEPAPGEERPDYEWRDLWGLAEYAEANE